MSVKARKRETVKVVNKDAEVDDRRDKKPAKAEKEEAAPIEKSPIPYTRILIRMILVFGCMAAFRFIWKNEPFDILASSKETYKKKVQEVTCSKDYASERRLMRDCIPTRCGRVVSDNIISREEAELLLRTAKEGLALGGSNGGASILDLHSGALSKGDNFVDIYALMKDHDDFVFTEKDFALYTRVKNKILRAVASEFKVPNDRIYLTNPTFFSRMTTTLAKTIHDEYWHVHVDKETYGSFHYTSLLYLTTYGEDFTGGRFVFVDEGRNTTVEPRLGRVSFFTSGSENPHYVEKIESGTRYAITVSFTCDASKAIDDPKLFDR